MKPTRHIVVAGMTLTLAFGMTPAAALAAESADSEIVGEAGGDAAAHADATEDTAESEDAMTPEASSEDGEAAEDSSAAAGEETVEEPAAYDKEDFYVEAPTVMMMSRAYAAPMAASIAPVALSDEMKYFTAYESGRNYDQGLSWGDGYHAMGYYQFDNRYGLDDFLISCYNYDPDTYSMFKWVLTTDITGDLYNSSTGKLTSIGTKLNSSWHAAYKADPAGFSALQDNWAYKEYYLPAEKYLKSLGIDISERADCVKGLVWGMSNLFGTGGWRKFVGGYTSGYDWNGTWHDSYKWPGAWNGDYKKANAMSDREFVTTLCDYVVNNVAVFYKAQPEYHAGWQNRYRSEKADCLAYIAEDEAQQADSLSYNANGGSGKMSATNGTVNKSVKVAACGFTRDGYEFMGWNTKKDGSGKSCAAGSSYTLTKGDDVLYAQWKKKQTVVPTPPAESDDAVTDGEGSSGGNGSGNTDSSNGGESGGSTDDAVDTPDSGSNSGAGEDSSNGNGGDAPSNDAPSGGTGTNDGVGGGTANDGSGSGSDGSNNEGEGSNSGSDEDSEPTPVPPTNDATDDTTSNDENAGANDKPEETPDSGSTGAGTETGGGSGNDSTGGADNTGGSQESNSNAASGEGSDNKTGSDESNASENQGGSSQGEDKSGDGSKSDEAGDADGSQSDQGDSKNGKSADEGKETLLKTNDESVGIVAALVGGFALAFGVAAGTLRRILGRN